MTQSRVGAVDEAVGVAQLVDRLLLQPGGEQPLVGGEAVEVVAQAVDGDHRGAAVELGLAEDPGEHRDEEVDAGDAEDAGGRRPTGWGGWGSFRRLARSRVELYWPRPGSKLASGSNQAGRGRTSQPKARPTAAATASSSPRRPAK